MSDPSPPSLDPPGLVEPRLLDFPPPATLSLDTSEVSATQALYQAAIGPVNTDRYLRLFTRFEAADRVVPSWNWAASLCTLGWMLFRGMGLGALVYLAVAAALLLTAGMLAGLVFRGAPEMQLGVGLAAALVLLLVPGILGDHWLYGHTRKRMARALADSASWTDAAALLGRRAVGWPRAGWVTLGHLALAGVLAAAVVLLPAGRAPWLSEWLDGRTAQVLVPAGSSPVPAAPASAVAAAQPSATPASTPTPTSTSTSTPASASAPSVAVAGTPLVVASAPASATSAVRPEPAAPAAAAASASVPAVVATRPLATTPATTKPTTPSAPKPTIPRAAPPPPAQGGHLLNVGLFAVESNARAAHARLRAAGLPATMQELQTSNGPRFRLRAGPFASRAAAEAAARRIRALGLEAQAVTAGARAER